MFYALLLPFLARKINRRLTHAFSLVAGGVGLISIYFIEDASMLKFSMVGVGLAWASILAMPYVILSASIPAGKLGIYMGIFNFFIHLASNNQWIYRRMDCKTPIQWSVYLCNCVSRYFYDLCSH